MTSFIKTNLETQKILEKINNLLGIDEIANSKFDISINTNILYESIESVGRELALQLVLQKLIFDNESSEYEKNIAQKIYFLIGIESFQIDNLFDKSPFIGLFGLKTLIQYGNKITGSSNLILNIDEAIDSLIFQLNNFTKKIE